MESQSKSPTSTSTSKAPIRGENGLVVVTDSREQRPWSLSLPTVTRALPAGDYSLLGLETRVALERKSIGDWVNTVIHDWLRFRKELNRLSGYDVAAVVIEGTPADIIAHRYESEANPESVIGRAHAVFLDHGIPVLWWGDRASAVHMAERFFTQAWKKLGDTP